MFTAILSVHDKTGIIEFAQGLAALGWDQIDLVAVNLFPFETTVAKADMTDEEGIENTNIGGVTLIRAAAKKSRTCYPRLRSIRLQ